MNIRKIGISVACFAAVVCLAYILGATAGEFFTERKVLRNRPQMREAILSKMENLAVGDTIPDFPLENLAFEAVDLSHFVQGRTVLIFMEPTCHSCLEDVEAITASGTSEADLRRFVFISSGNPRHLIDLLGEYADRLIILYDHMGAFSSQFGVFTFPFHIVVSGDRIVEEVIPGALLADDIKHIVTD